MASLRLEHIYKVYPNGTKAVNDFCLDIKDKEFIVFVGPSGCGKSTTLRMIAGLEEISAGELYIGDTMVNDMEPKDRDIAMVFQNYALYPHMTVYENMAFGLTLRHVPREQIHEKVMWAADVLGLKEYLDRKPKAMSGGQRQRVSLGRAILRNPKVMLLDEPLSNLDAKLRSQMRTEISKLHHNLGTTFIYVTHDQVEAMTLGTRVVVMKLGRIQQVDTPKNLYDYPENKFVAGFIGTPQMNFFNIRLNQKGDEVTLSFTDINEQFVMPANKFIKVDKTFLHGNKDVSLGIRCENLKIKKNPTDKTKCLPIYISHFEELGNETLIYAELKEEGLGKIDSTTKIIIKAENKMGLETGTKAYVEFDLDKAHFFDAVSEKTIAPRIPTHNIFDVVIKDNTLYGKFKLPPVFDIKSFEGSIDFPLDAILFGKTGLKATVNKIENINGKNLVHLLINGTILFALGDDKIKEGDEVLFTIDYSKVSFVNKDGKVEYPTLKEYDDVYASFVNLKTASSKDPVLAEKMKKIQEEKIAEVNAKFDTLKEEILTKSTKDKEADRLEIEKVGSDAILAEYNESVSNLKKIQSEAKAVYDEKMANAKKFKHDGLAKIKADVKEEFEARLHNENNDFKMTLATNKDRDFIRLRKEEHTKFLEMNKIDKKNEYEHRESAFCIEADALFNSAKNEYKLAISTAKEKMNLAKTKYNRLTNLDNYYDKQVKTALSNLEKERAKAIHLASLLFFFNINEHYFLIPTNISNKIIQGLGSKVFNKTYRISIPHDGYTLTDANEGVHAKLMALLDYTNTKFVRAESEFVSYDGAPINIILDVHKYNFVDRDITFTIDFEKCQISETGMNIRLY
ncbi:MAG: ABC transporter ATP-binding protein [Bacilli bacterium]